MDRKLVSSPVLWKLSDLLVNESVPFLGLEDQLESIESKLRDIVNSEYFDCKRDVAYDIEEAIDFLLEKATQKSQRGILLSHVLAFVDSMDEKKLRKKLDRISLEIFRATDKLGRRKGMMDPWPTSNSTSKKQLDAGESIISPVIRKVIVLASQEQINPSVRRQARWVRDEMRLLHVYVKDLEYKELRGEEMAWMEEVTLFSRSAEDVIGFFLSGTEHSSRKNGAFKNLGFSPFKFKSQNKLRKEMDLMKTKVQEIIKRFGKLPHQMYIPPPRFPPNLPPPPPIPFQPNFPGRFVPNLPGDATSLSSFDDDEFDDFDEIDDGTPSFPGHDDQNQPSDMSTFDGNAGSSSSSSSRRAEYPDVSTFDCNMNDIKELLTRDDPNFLTVSVLGMEGSGKTKLVKSVYENPAIRDHFPHRAWVNWVRDSNINRFMEQIVGAPYMNIRLMNGDWDDYLCRLRRLLNDFLMDKRYLIVIDGVSSKVLWNQLGSAFDGLSNGSRVVFISSKAGVTPEDGERNFTYRLQLWSDEESWSLFARSLNVNIPLELLELKKREILRVCGGLPKAIVKLAELLARENTFAEDWSRVIDKFNNDEGSWSGTLQEINKNLPLYLRRCLFYFRFFPQHFEIPVRRLIGLWVAEDLGHQKNVKDSPEHVALKCLIELVNRNMIQVTKKKLNGEIKTCRLPDPLRVHWLLKAKEANFLNDNGHIGDNLGTSSGTVRRLVDHLDPRQSSFDHIHGDNANSSSLYSCYRETVSFLSFDTRDGSRPGEDVGNFLERCIANKCFSSLWVLDLEHVYKPKLPKAVSQLTGLKYLGLRSTHLEMLPSFINKLLKLQTLDLKHTGIDALPSSVWMMQELRHLFLDESSCCRFAPPPKGSCLTEIQTLWGAFVTVDSPVRDGLDTFLKLRKLGLTCKISDPSQNEAMSSQLDAVASWVVKLTHLQSLKLKSFNELGQPSDIVLESLSAHMYLSSIHLAGNLKNQHLLSELPENLVELTLSASGLEEDPMQMIDKLPNLRILRLFSGAFTGTKMVCSSGGFPKLQVLKLWELEALEEWSIEEGAMPSLKCLEIKSCRNLEILPEGLQNVKTLLKLKLKDMAVLSARINDNQGEDWDKVAHVLHVYTDN
ncbi:probable disease resistance protein RF9 [Euphorbia lathyris]|uniref:probable disease resistance protein RF9 n=1 Tax=Euphorbia lathyris TaxID=212925 RepID=UPI00331381F0